VRGTALGTRGSERRVIATQRRGNIIRVLETLITNQTHARILSTAHSLARLFTMNFHHCLRVGFNSSDYCLRVGFNSSDYCLRVGFYNCALSTHVMSPMVSRSEEQCAGRIFRSRVLPDIADHTVGRGVAPRVSFCEGTLDTL